MKRLTMNVRKSWDVELVERKLDVIAEILFHDPNNEQAQLEDRFYEEFLTRLLTTPSV